MVPWHVKCLHVLYDSYGPPYLIWNGYHLVPPHVHMVPDHMYNMTYDLPLLIWNRYRIVPPLSYMKQLWYGPPTCTYHPPKCEVSSCLIWLLWSPIAYRIGVIWSPTCMYGPPHVLYDSYGRPYLIWNRYCMVPLTLYGTGII